MDNDTYDDRHSRQQKFNKNIVKRLEEIEDLSAQFDIAGRLLRNDNQILRQEFEEFQESTLIRLDQGVENRTKAFNKIDQIEEDLDIIDITLERHADILVVHRNQLDNKGKHEKRE